MIAAPRRLMGLQPPMRAALLLALFLIFCTLLVVVVFTIRDDVPHADVLRNPRWIVSVLMVLIITPVATYYMVRLWLEGDVSRYPDIDRAWEDGISALAENGIEVRDLPLYVILGIPNEAAASSLFSAARLVPIVAGVPRGPGPLHWYATEQAIYLVCTSMGRMGRLSQLAAAASPTQRSSSAGGGSSDITATMVVGSARDTGDFAGPSPPGTISESSSIYGTLVASGGGSEEGGGGATPQPVASSGLSRKEAEEQSDRLHYLLGRLRNDRRPYCANNGVLSILPHRVLSDITYAKDAADAVQADLATVRQASQVASAVTVLVSGMEAEPGFTELVRRVGVDRSQNSRFGKGFNVWNLASDENLDALSAGACGSFEDWVYTLFADSGNEQDSNGKLYAMMCRVRRHLQPRIRAALVSGFAEEGEGGPPRLFSGCYFAATGAGAQEQAFVRSVFEKLSQLSEDLQWDDAALGEEDGFRWTTRLLTVVNAVLLVAVGILAYRCIAALFE